ncbi:unnamed protein product [Knipowitschia caucasica]
MSVGVTLFSLSRLDFLCAPQSVSKPATDPFLRRVRLPEHRTAVRVGQDEEQRTKGGHVKLHQKRRHDLT